MTFIPILYRHIIRETTAIFLATCLILVAIILSFRAANLLNAAVAGEMTLAAVGQLLLLQGIRFLVILIPLAFVLAVTMTFGRLYRDHEISAMFAGGVGFSQLLKALLLLVMPVALILASLTLIVLPEIYQRQDNLRQKAEQEAGMMLFAPNTFRQLDDALVVHTQAIDNNILKDFFVAQQRETEYSVIFADSGQTLHQDGRRFLQLNQGQRFTWHADLAPDTMSISNFQRAVLRLPNTEITNSNRLRNLPTAALNQTPAHQSEWQTRLNPVIALFIFTLLLPLLTKTQPRQGRYQKILPIFLLFALYINLLDTITMMVRKERIAVYPGSYSLHIGVFIVIVLLWAYQMRGQRK